VRGIRKTKFNAGSLVEVTAIPCFGKDKSAGRIVERLFGGESTSSVSIRSRKGQGMKSLIQRSAVMLVVGWWFCSSDLVAAASAPGLRLVEQRKADAAKKEMLYLTKEELLEGARKEGRVVVHPGMDETSIPDLIHAFKKRYPFLKEVVGARISGIPAAQREVLEMVSGQARVDSFSPHSTHWSDYTKYKLIQRYDLKTMATDGQFKVPLGMIDDSGVMIWTATNQGAIAYSARLAPEALSKGWESCLDPVRAGKFAVDTKPNVLAWLVPSWGEERVLNYARKLKSNKPIWNRGTTSALTKLAAGEYEFICGAYAHTAQRLLKKDPTLAIKLMIPDPFPVTFNDPNAIYTKAQSPHAGLLWMEFLASNEAQDIMDALDPGIGSFLVEGTVSSKWVQGRNVSLCGSGCRDKEETFMQRIAVEAWELPKVGAEAK
jgi:Bacterial extracellular solute-binding protein